MLDDALQRVGEKILGFCLMSIKCIDTYLLVASTLETIYLSYLVSFIGDGTAGAEVVSVRVKILPLL